MYTPWYINEDRTIHEQKDREILFFIFQHLLRSSFRDASRSFYTIVTSRRFPTEPAAKMMMRSMKVKRPYSYGRLDMIEGMSNATANKEPSCLTSRREQSYRDTKWSERTQCEKCRVPVKPPRARRNFPRSLECDEYKSAS